MKILTVTLLLLVFLAGFALLVSAEEKELPPLPEKIQKLLKRNASVLDIVLDVSFSPTFARAKIYFRTNDDEAIAFIVAVLVKVDGGGTNFPEKMDENSIIGVRQFGSGGFQEEWINKPLLEKLEKDKDKTEIF